MQPRQVAPGDTLHLHLCKPLPLQGFLWALLAPFCKGSLFDAWLLVGAGGLEKFMLVCIQSFFFFPPEITESVCFQAPASSYTVEDVMSWCLHVHGSLNLRLLASAATGFPRGSTQSHGKVTPRRLPRRWSRSAVPWGQQRELQPGPGKEDVHAKEYQSNEVT